jgi:hypothetical protein
MSVEETVQSVYMNDDSKDDKENDTEPPIENIDMERSRFMSIFMSRLFPGHIITSHPVNYYIDFTSMCRAGGRHPKDFWRVGGSNINMDYLKEFVRYEAEMNSVDFSIILDANKITSETPPAVIYRARGSGARSWIHPKASLYAVGWISPMLVAKITEYMFLLQRSTAKALVDGSAVFPCGYTLYSANRVPPEEAIYATWSTSADMWCAFTANEYTSKYKRGKVYVIREGVTKLAKIGYTCAKGVKNRLSTLQVGNSQILSLECCINCDDAPLLESLLHERLKELHERGEWFRLPIPCRTTVIASLPGRVRLQRNIINVTLH